MEPEQNEIFHSLVAIIYMEEASTRIGKTAKQLKS